MRFPEHVIAAQFRMVLTFIPFVGPDTALRLKEQAAAACSLIWLLSFEQVKVK